ncbi:hypothetical protein Taro_023263 [Colocasia esculenta]|uniref:Uncharacterized protein n=1 Tax=Colocasia esculenta TaxID=4460 RepID=A0A843UWY5_COLES|nr:hypothetical protein [Colocasia esculenta]
MGLWEHTLHHDLHTAGHFFNPQYMYRTDGRNENYDNASEVLIGAKNVIKRKLDNENRAIIACKQMHDYRLQLYHFGTSTAQRAAQILSPGELDDVPLLPEFTTPPAPKRQKKTMGARVRSKKHGINIVGLETIEEDNDDETPEPSDNLKKKMQEEWERQEKLRMEFETMEQASDTSSYASTEGYYQGQGGYMAYPRYLDASGPLQPPLAQPDSAGLGPDRPNRDRDQPARSVWGRTIWDRSPGS